jgi:hypothetical protein
MDAHEESVLVGQAGLRRPAAANQRLATYIVISKPKRRLQAFGVSHCMVVSFSGVVVTTGTGRNDR